MEAAIAKILSDDIDIDNPEHYDFAEGGRDSDGDNRDVLGPGNEAEEEQEEEDEQEGGSDADAEEEGQDDDEDDDEWYAGLDGPGHSVAEREEAGSSDEDEGGSGDGDGGGGGAAAPSRHKSFLEGGRADTFARAFARIVGGDGSIAAPGSEVPILAGSKSVAKRKAEDAHQVIADRAAKRLRQEMKQRGHVVPSRRGEDPEADAREKALQRVATRGVVRLFNAVTKAQRQIRDAEGTTGSRGKAAKLGKASFLAELRSAQAGGGGANEALVPSTRAAMVGAVEGGDANDGEATAGWDVLKDGFTGLQGGNKLKDWDRRQPGDEALDDPSGTGDADSGSGESEDDGGW